MDAHRGDRVHPDHRRGNDGLDRLLGGDGSDKLRGGEEQDWLEGGGGNDELRGGEGWDYLFGEGGDDLLVQGGPVPSHQNLANLFGGFGDDRLIGSDTNDNIAPGPGRDVVEGRGGNDSSPSTPVRLPPAGSASTWPPARLAAGASTGSMESSRRMARVSRTSSRAATGGIYSPADAAKTSSAAAQGTTLSAATEGATRYTEARGRPA